MDAAQLLETLPAARLDSPPDSAHAEQLLGALGIGGGQLPDRLAPVLGLVDTLPHELVERLLIELLARAVEPQ
jgi:hypothetical protein